MPSYIEFSKQATLPAASDVSKVVFGITDQGTISLTNSSGSIVGGPILTVTVSELQALISGSLLSPGTLYDITDADSNNDLYNGTEIILQAISTNSLNPKGVGKFYNPKYDQDVEGFGIWNPLIRLETINPSGSFQYNEAYLGNGVSASYAPYYQGIVFNTNYDGGYNYLYPDNSNDNWSNITSLTGSDSGATIEVTSVSQASYASGSTVIWGGKIWGNLSGSIGNFGMGSQFELNSEDWVAIPYNETDYNVSWDEIEYDVVNDFITMRKEVLTGNIVEQTYADWIDWEYYRAILTFQWGNPYQYNNNRNRSVGMGQNRMNNSMFMAINFGGEHCTNNEFKNYSYFGDCYFVGNVRISANTLNSSGIYQCFFSGDNGNFQNNVLNDSSMGFSFMAGHGNITDNILNNSYIGSNSLVYSSIQSNFLIDSYIGDNYMQYNCYINDNTLHSATIGDDSNYLTNNCYINNNSISNQSYISSLHMDQNAYVQQNSLTVNSYIEGIIIDLGGNITYNSLSGDSSIYGGVVHNSSNINYNTLTSEGYIGDNIVVDSSNIFNNSVNSSGIYENNMSNLNITIAYNTLNNNSQITTNTMDNSNYITNCALFNGANLTGQTTTVTNNFYANLP